MPNRIVRIHPPGSGPGVKSFATTPTISPNNIQPMIDMTSPPFLKDCAEVTAACVRCPLLVIMTTLPGKYGAQSGLALTKIAQAG